MGPFVLAETTFPSLGASASSKSSGNGSVKARPEAYHSNHRGIRVSGWSSEATPTKPNKKGSILAPAASTPTSTGTTTSTSTSSSLEDFNFGDQEEHNVEVIHSSPGRRSQRNHPSYRPRNDSRTTTITSTRRKVEHEHQEEDEPANAKMSLQLDRYGFITNIDSKGHILETNGAENIKVPSYADSERTERREKKWKATLQGWDKQARQQGVGGGTGGSKQLKQPSRQHGSSAGSGPSGSSPNSVILQRKPAPRNHSFASGNKVVLRRLRKGVPDSVRGKTWLALGGGIRVPGMYQDIVRVTSDAMLTNCRELQRTHREAPHATASGGRSSPSSNTGGSGSGTPERSSNPASTRTSPTSAVSEASTFTNPSPTKPNKGASSSSPEEAKPSPVGHVVDAASGGRSSSPTTPRSSGIEKDETKPSGKEKSGCYAATRDFRSIQDIIERDIHRTFPRHNLFYEEERSIVESPSSSTGGDREDPLESPSAGTTPGDPELAALILNLEMDLKVAESGDMASANNGLKQYKLHDRTDHCTITATTQSGQAALRRVLRAYSYYDPEVGYCQGMNFIAGMFLTLMTEEEAFWLLVSVMSDKPCHMRGLFGEGMLQTHKVLYVAEKLTHHYLSRLARHFEKEHVHVTMYATQWLLTQYTSSFKFDLVVRVWDAFLGEGWKIIYRVMLALLLKYQPRLLKMSFEEILTFFRELPERVEGGQIMDMALKIPLRRKVIARYEREWESQQKKK